MPFSSLREAHTHGNILSDMPFFFIIPIWFLFVLAGIVMICMTNTRRLGVYVLVVPTTATTISFLLSTALLFAGPGLFPNPPSWLPILLMLGYLATIVMGGVVGAVVGFAAVRKMLPSR